MSIETPKRYSALWVTLHWLIALLLLAVFYLGFSTRTIPPADWLVYVRWHIPLGLAILILMVIRIIVRWRTPHPEPATTGNALLDKIGVLTHYLLYVFAIIMPLAGMVLASTYDLIPIQFGAISNTMPGLHRLIAPVLAVLIVLHILAALYHQVIKKDNLMSRMWYEK